MNLASLLSYVSIRTQILFAFAPTILILALLTIISLSNFNLFFENFDNLAVAKKERITFQEIERDLLELQRNILVYSYVGYKGVLRKINYTQEKLDQKFSQITKIIEEDSKIHSRFNRLLEHFQDYKSGFQEAVKERKAIKALEKEELEPALEAASQIIRSVINSSKSTGAYHNAFLASQLKLKLYKVRTNIQLFGAMPDAALVRETLALFKSIKEESKKLNVTLPNQEHQKQDYILQSKLDELTEKFTALITLHRVYLNLINVVLAGKSAEINILLIELNELAEDHYNALNHSIENNISTAQESYLTFALFAVVIGILCAWIIARNIVNPITMISATLSKLANGEDADIPAQDRKDELGKMAESAQEFKQLAMRLERSNTELDKFAYITSHDLKSPLRVIDNATSWLEEDLQNLDEESKENMGLIRSRVMRMEQLLDDLLEYSRVGRKIDHTYEETISGDEMAQTVLALITPPKSFNIDFSPAFNVLQLKRMPLQQIFFNLINNAIKHHDKKSGTISVEVENYGEYYCFHVKDDGPGIAPQYQEKVFQMFQTLQSRDKVEGSGIGLALVKKHIEHYQGNITLSSEKGNGCIFTFTWPINQINE